MATKKAAAEKATAATKRPRKKKADPEVAPVSLDEATAIANTRNEARQAEMLKAAEEAAELVKATS